MNEIEWTHKIEHNISRWAGHINGIYFFEIYQFKNETFTDPFVMSSKIIPGGLNKSEDLGELKDIASNIVLDFNAALTL